MNNLWRTMRGVKIRLAAKDALLIQQAFNNYIDVDKVVNDWLDMSKTSDVTTQEARDWARINIHVNDSSLSSALKVVYADGYVFGKDMGAAALANAVVHKAAKPQLQPLNTQYWKDWKVGNRAAANLVSPQRGLAKLMDSRGVTLVGIKGTTLDRIGTQLAYALQRGLPPSTVAPAIEGMLAPLRQKIADELGADINKMLSDSERALTIAQTEMSRAVSVAAREQYQDSGVEMVEWLTADPCDACAENEDVSPIPINEDFPSGDSEPPAHPNCECSFSPYVVDTQNINDALSFDSEE